MLCEICNGNTKKIETFFKHSVSSDNKPLFDKKAELYRCSICGHLQKKADQNILNEIYSDYCVDILTPNQAFYIKNQASGEYVSRSMEILSNCVNYIPKKERMSCLDIGSGCGDMLKSFLETFKESDIFACDLNRQNEDFFKANIGGFKEMYGGLFDIKVENKFDLITMIHSLEHMSDLYCVLEKISKIMARDGSLIIQVPDIRTSLLDIYTYDHLHHFSVETLCLLVECAGFDWILPTCQLDRQITLICKKSTALKEIEVSYFLPYHNIENELLCFFNQINEVRMSKKKWCVFGSSTLSTFVGSVLSDSLAYFIDENPYRKNLYHLGKEVVSTLKENTAGIVIPFEGNLGISKFLKFFPFTRVLALR